MKKVSYEVTPEGYSVAINGKQVYTAGNHPSDSQAYLSAGSPYAVPEETLMIWAKQTAQEFADELGGVVVGR